MTKYYFLVTGRGCDEFCVNLGTDKDKAIEQLYKDWNHLSQFDQKHYHKFEIDYGYESCDKDEEYEGITDCLYDVEYDVVEDIFRTCDRCGKRYPYNRGYHTEDTHEDICEECFCNDTHCFTCATCGKSYAFEDNSVLVDEELYCIECKNK